MKTNELYSSELTVIANEISFKGELEVSHELHFYGKLTGKIIGLPGSKIFIKECASVEGIVHADQLIIEGFVKGEITCKNRLWVTPNGKVIGSVKTPSMTIDPGAIFEVNISMK